MELRIQLDAVLGTLCNREIILEWDSGNPMAKARRRDDNATYRLDREECHGIKEQCVLLTHLYDDRLPILIIDEPELNLHPQYQEFFMREVRKLASGPNNDSRKKLVFLLYEGDHYSLSEGSKQKAVQAELDYLASPRATEVLGKRYGDLYHA